ncbi:MAG: TatD family deoxyribonuclease [Bacteriovoracaceae bacterium]|nr:TatD family deoxyribonuclease [Bacteriovoracaceae bacterium]
MKLIDTHTHLSSEEFNDNRAEVVARALKVCDYIIDIGSGTSKNAFQRAKDLAEAHPEVYFTAGIHPHDAEALGKNEEILKEIESLLTHPKCVGVGEAGLDYFYKHSSREAQISVFKWHIKLAEKYKLPLTIHTRDAEEDTKDLLKNFEGPAVFHCFTGTQDLANFGLTKKIWISFSGIVTFKNAQDLRNVFLSLPLDRVLLETDSPFLAPVPMRGKTNESAFIEHTAKFLADLKKISLEELTNTTSKNALSLFSKIKK